MRATGRRQKEWFEQKRAGERGKREGEDEGRLSREEAHLCSLRFTCYPVFSPRSFPGTLALRRPGTSTTTTTTLWHRGRRGSSVPCFLLFYFPFFIFTLWSFLPSPLVLSPSAFHLCTLIKARRTEGRLAALAQDTRTRPSGLDLEPPRLEAEGWRRLGLGRSSPSFFTGHGGTLHRWGDAPLSLDSSFPFLSRSLLLYFSTLSVRRGYLTCTISL